MPDGETHRRQRALPTSPGIYSAVGQALLNTREREREREGERWSEGERERLKPD
jgi:hypothetical protein